MNNIIENAKNKGITLTNDNGTWTAEFGSEHLMSTTMLESMEKFLNECELVESPNFLGLRIGGWIEHKRAKAST